MKHRHFIITMIVTIAIIVTSGKIFLERKKVEKVGKGLGVFEVEMLSKYEPSLKGTPGDTEIFHLKGKEDGGSILVLGGTHANEPSGYLAATMIVETLEVEKGDVYIIPQANKSAFTHNDAQEGNEVNFNLKTKSGNRVFTYGSRATNPTDQWPDPDIYIHKASGQKLSGGETRNLNRAYPGRIDGTLTEKVAYGIISFINKKKIDVSVDLHEASPEYPVINALVAPVKGMEIASSAIMNLQMEGIEMGLEPSPKNLHGLSHREWTDYTDTYAFLMETANASQGRLRGASSKDLIVTGVDRFYEKLAKIGMLFVPYTEDGHPITQRVARQIAGINALMSAFGEFNPEKEIIFSNVPTYDEMMENGLGSYLK